MTQKPAYTIPLLSIGVLTIIGLFLFRKFQSAQGSDTLPKIEEDFEDPNKLYPYELFYLDRNYPDHNAPDGIFQDKLRQSIQFDKASPRSHRGLDYPWTIQGPGNIGGRVNAIAVHPANHNIILLGYSQGGIYRTEDNGENWEAVFDDHASLSIGHISFDPHNPDRVFATTGDVNISGYPFLGSGVYRSEDAGLTWTQSGLTNTGVLSKVVVDPHEADILYVGSMGYPSHKGNERGLFISTDGGNSWNQTLFVDDSTGIIDVVADPLNPGRVFACGWTRLRSSTISTLTGPGIGLYVSTTYGQNWVAIGSDILPGEYHSRTSLEIANDGTLFISYIGAVTEGECGGDTESLKGIFKSTDGGFSWDTIHAEPLNGVPCGLLGGFGWYFEALKVNPENSMDMFLLGVDIYRTLDGGLSWFEAAPSWWTYEVHADKHDLVFAGDDMFLGTDGGAYRQRLDMSDEWTDIENIPSTQFYRTAYNPHLSDQYFGGAQDNGTTGGNESIINEWPRLFGGDGFQPLFDPAEPMWIYVLTQNGSVWVNQDSQFHQLNHGLFGTRYWDMPFVMSPHDPKILFCGSHVMFKINMLDTAREWIPISPDLTRGDTILGNRYPAITAIAQSELNELRLYAGTQDGKLWTTNDGGINWIDITDGSPGYYVTSITSSTMNPQGVIVTYSGYRDNDHTPYIYRSENAGETWTLLGTNMPMLGVNSFLILPGWNDEVLFAGTDGGVYVSVEGGIEWERLGTNFPYMPVYDLEYNPVENTIVAATFSRGLMTFPVEELDLVSGVDQVSQNRMLDQVTIYPTIVQEHITIDFESYRGSELKFKVSIIDISGHVMEELKINLSGSKRIKLKLDGDLSRGIYFVLVSNQDISKIIGSVVVVGRFG